MKPEKVEIKVKFLNGKIKDYFKSCKRWSATKYSNWWTGGRGQSSLPGGIRKAERGENLKEHYVIEVETLLFLQ